MPQRENQKCQTDLEWVWSKFSPETLATFCERDEEDFADAFDMTTTYVDQREPSDFYAFKDNGSRILAVAHLDTVVDSPERKCAFVNTADGWVVYSGALDDRLGAYIILDLLPRLGMNVDVLLTVGEEQGRSTAQYFEPEKDYDWIIEFDRGGTDVVMYQYEDKATKALVEDCGARVGKGSFSDIAYLEHLGVKAFNWGVGYEDYHGPRSHAFLDDTLSMVVQFIEFFEVNEDVHLEHLPKKQQALGYAFDDDDDLDNEEWWAKYKRETMTEEELLVQEQMTEEEFLEEEEYQKWIHSQNPRRQWGVSNVGAATSPGWLTSKGW